MIVSFLANGFSVIFPHKCKKSFEDKQKEIVFILDSLVNLDVNIILSLIQDWLVHLGNSENLLQV